MGRRRGSRPVFGPALPPDSTLTVGIKQGAGAVTSTPFGGGQRRRPRPPPRRRRNGGRGFQRMGLTSKCFDAFAPQHLALPRAVAPYTVIRTTAIWNPDTDDQRRFCMFGPTIDVAHDAGQWTSAYAIGTNTALTSLRHHENGARHYGFGAMNTSSWSAASITPAAFSIQILNPEALQTSTGMVYVGRCKNKVHLAEGDNSSSWKDLADSLVSFSNPRMCSAGKLALRGVQVDAVPNNMSELAKFTSLQKLLDANYTLDSSNVIHQDGFNPIFLYNPDAVDLQVLVCCEWRVRFDPSNPAYAANTFHKPASETDWATHLQRAVATGSGVVDIVEQVARAGRAVGLL